MPKSRMLARSMAVGNERGSFNTCLASLPRRMSRVWSSCARQGVTLIWYASDGLMHCSITRSVCPGVIELAARRRSFSSACVSIAAWLARQSRHMVSWVPSRAKGSSGSRYPAGAPCTMILPCSSLRAASPYLKPRVGFAMACRAAATLVFRALILRWNLLQNAVTFAACRCRSETQLVRRVRSSAYVELLVVSLWSLSGCPLRQPHR